MHRLPLAFVCLLFLSAPVFATAGFNCTADDKNVAVLEAEGLAGSEGNLVKLDAMLELSPGEKITLTKSDIKSFVWEKTLALRAAKPTPRGLLELRIEARPKPDDETEFEGTYAIRIAKRTINGKIKCSGG